MEKGQPHQDKTYNNQTNKGRGTQGTEKVPGEETPTDVENVIWETQKGKKVDGDPSQESDQPIDQHQ